MTSAAVNTALWDLEERQTMKPIRPQSIRLWSLRIHAPPETRLDHHDLPYNGDRLIRSRVGMQSIWRIPHEGLGDCKRRFGN